jgi:methyl-accepting chemotaxis protein
MNNKKPPEHKRQRYFVSREVQLTIAILVVLALLGGIFLQSISTALINFFGLKTPALGIFLILGYVALVMLLSIFFSHRLVGPFKRLEYEMRNIRSGDAGKRLSVRTKDDLPVKHFIGHVNTFISRCELTTKEYDTFTRTVSASLENVIKDLSEEGCDADRVREELKSLQAEIRKFREKVLRPSGS